MEGHPMPMDAELGAEALRSVDFSEIYADREATLFGVTATLQELKKMCPVDLSDPSKLDMVNTFVVKVANEAGWEIQPEHAPAFVQITETNGIEQKFTVAAKTDQNPAEAPKPSELQDTRPIPKESPATPVAAEVHTPSEVSPKLEVHKAILHLAELRLIQDLQYQLRAKQNEPETITPTPRPKTKVHKNSVATDFPDSPKTAKVAEQPAQRLEKTTPIKLAPPTPMAIKADEQVLHIEDQAEEQILYISENLPLLMDAEPVPAAEINLTPEPSAASAWESELNKEPEELYDTFVLNLENFALSMVEPQGADPGELPETDALPLNPEIAVQIATIVNLVSERLQAVNDKDRAMAHVTNIVGAVHGIHVLEERNADPDHIELAKLQLETFATMLFQELGIEPTEESIKLFIQALLSPEFTPKQQQTDAVGIAEIGTYETKVLAGQPLSRLQMVEQRAHRLLGQVAVFYARALHTLHIEEVTISPATSA